MKKIPILNRYSTGCMLLFLLELSACKKVDNDLAQQEAMPSIKTDYPSLAITGDTLTVTGRLHVDDGGTLTLGNEQAVFISRARKEDTVYDAPGGRVVLDIVRFIVTPGMGSGPQPLVAHHGNYVSTAPAITILAPPHLPYSTDTTLTVTELFAGTIPSFTTRYSGNSVSDGFIFGCRGVTAGGEVWLEAPLDIYHFHAGGIDNYLKAGDHLQLEGQDVTIRNFFGVAADTSGHTLYLSLKGSLPKDPATTGSWWLVKKDLVSGLVTVLNHTVYYLDNVVSGTIIATMPAQQRSNGPIASIPLRATDLKVDIRGRLLFVNDYNTFLGRIEADGKVTDLLEGGRAPGTDRLKYSSLLAFSFDGLTAFIVPAAGGLMTYDLDAGGPVVKIDDGQPVMLVSFEPRPEYRFQNRFFKWDGNQGAGSFAGLANGELLQRPYNHPSTLVAIDLARAGLYAYAGLEAAYGGDAPLAQQNITGPARSVNFGGMNNDLANTVNFLGADAAGNLYFTRGGMKSGAMVSLPRIYRLGK